MSETIHSNEHGKDAPHSQETKSESLAQETKGLLEQFSTLGEGTDTEIATAAEALLSKIDSVPKDSRTMKLINEHLHALQGANNRVTGEKFVTMAKVLHGNLS